MLEHTFARPCVIARLRGSQLGPYLDNLATALHHDGYAPSSIQRFLRAAEKFAHWGQDQGYSVCEMDEDLLHRYLSGLARYRSGNLPKAAQGLGHLVRFLQQQGVARPRPAALPAGPLDQWLRDYDAHLEHVAGLARSTRQTYGHLVGRFITACFGAQTPDWTVVTPARITTFVTQEAALRQKAGRKLPAVAVRSFLRFLVFRGEIRPGLEAAAPSPPQWKYASLPSRLTRQEVEQVLAVYHEGTTLSLRNRAMLFLLARLGLRAQDVVSLCLDDIDWANGTSGRISTETYGFEFRLRQPIKRVFIRLDFSLDFLRSYLVLSEKRPFSLQAPKGTSQLSNRVRKLIQKSKSGKLRSLRVSFHLRSYP